MTDWKKSPYGNKYQLKKGEYTASVIAKRDDGFYIQIFDSNGKNTGFYKTAITREEAQQIAEEQLNKLVVSSEEESTFKGLSKNDNQAFNTVLNWIAGLAQDYRNNYNEESYQRYATKLETLYSELEELRNRFKTRLSECMGKVSKERDNKMKRQTKLSSVLKKIKLSATGRYNFMWIGGYVDIVMTSKKLVSLTELIKANKDRLSLLDDEDPLGSVSLGVLTGDNPEKILYFSGTTREVYELNSVEEANDWLPKAITDTGSPILYADEDGGYTGTIYKLVGYHNATKQEITEIENAIKQLIGDKPKKFTIEELHDYIESNTPYTSEYYEDFPWQNLLKIDVNGTNVYAEVFTKDSYKLFAKESNDPESPLWNFSVLFHSVDEFDRALQEFLEGYNARI